MVILELKQHCHLVTDQIHARHSLHQRVNGLYRNYLALQLSPVPLQIDTPYQTQSLLATLVSWKTKSIRATFSPLYYYFHTECPLTLLPVKYSIVMNQFQQSKEVIHFYFHIFGMLAKIQCYIVYTILNSYIFCVLYSFEQL